jgi:outer membrane protein insertion porin family/translocation and assembly module TamA
MEYGFTRAEGAALCALFNRCEAEAQSSLLELATLGIASASLTRLRTDNPISPTRGYATRAEIRTSASSLLGTSPSLFFNKATADAVWYRPASATAVFAIRLRGGVVVGRRASPTDPGFVPPQERLYAGGATSVRGFQQNELGDVVYIARNASVDSTLISSTPDEIWRMHATDGADVSRTVPLGGNTLAVINLDYRVRDPFFFPDVLQYTLFVDGGQIWTRTLASGIEFQPLKWTPGIGVRALTFFGPVQVNVGWNPYRFEDGPLYYNPNVNTLYCVTPGNTIDLKRDPTTLLLKQVDDEACPRTFSRPARRSWWQQLTFTFSIGPDF